MQIRITIINTFTFKNTVFSKNIVFLWLCISSETKNVKIKYKYCKYAISINCADTQFGQVYIQREFIHSIYWKTDLLNIYGNFCYSSGLQHVLLQHFHIQCPQKKKESDVKETGDFDELQENCHGQVHFGVNGGKCQICGFSLLCEWWWRLKEPEGDLDWVSLNFDTPSTLKYFILSTLKYFI